MATIPAVLLATLDDLDDEGFKKFTWHLLNSGLTDNLIPEGKLKKADRSEAVVLMVQQYKSDAGKIAIRALREMKQNLRADQLERKLIQFENQVQQPEQASVRKAPIQQPEQASVRKAPIQQPEQMDVEEMESDWTRPGRITPCTLEFKDRILSENGDNIYKLKENTSQRKRLALLITNIKFDHIPYRNGAARDEENMKWLLKELGYRVEEHRNLSGEEIDDKVKKFAAHSEHQDSDSTFVVIMSHGGIIDNKDAILGVHYDGKLNPNDYFHVDKIFSHLNSDNCRALIDKPKVILIQACRGEHKGGLKIQSDAIEYKSDVIVHVEKDFVCFKSCVPGVCAYRNSGGSFFINYIVEVFSELAHNTDIYKLFTRITSRMEKDTLFKHYYHEGKPAKILPCIDRGTLPKDLYLFPGL